MAEILDLDEMSENCDSAEQAIMKAEELLSEKERSAARDRGRSRETDVRLARKYKLPN